jgi:endonuclease III
MSDLISPASERINEVISRLEQKFPDAKYELDWANPWQLLIATILAAQATDERVNKVTPVRRSSRARAGAHPDRLLPAQGEGGEGDLAGPHRSLRR